jgi:hypothetical protein
MRTTTLIIALIALSFGLRAAEPEPGKSGKSNDVKTVNETPTMNVSPGKSDSKRWKNGFIVTLKGDTIMGKIKTMDFLDALYDYQHAVAFKSDRGFNQYSPNDLKSFSYNEEQNKTVTLQAVSSPEGNGRVFLKLYYNGPCKVYGLTESQIKADNAPQGIDAPQMQSSLVTKEKKYFQVGNSQFYPIQRAGFKKNMKEVFASCPKIVEGLNSNRYNYEKWQDLIKDYNNLAH